MRKTATKSMSMEVFMKMVSQSKLAVHAEFLRSIARPAIDLVPTSRTKKSGASRFGGLPELGKEGRWPLHDLDECNHKLLQEWSEDEEENGGESGENEDGRYAGDEQEDEENRAAKFPYAFLCQLNFAEMPPVAPGLPSQGILSLFVKYESKGEMGFFERDPDFLHAVFSSTGAKTTALSKPKYVETAPSRFIAFRPTVDIPYDRYQRNDWPFDFREFDEEYRELRNSLHCSDRYLFGYPAHCSLAYDPSPGPDWVPLLVIDSFDEWCWHDGDRLMVFIKSDSLAHGDFSELKCDAG